MKTTIIIVFSALLSSSDSITIYYGVCWIYSTYCYSYYAGKIISYTSVSELSDSSSEISSDNELDSDSISVVD